jgi:peptidoglycan/xylan/chitin deacetylase (PgdA/CDA1 family)
VLRSGVAASGVALAQYLPSTAVLATWLATPPEGLPRGWCRWRGPAERRRVALTFDDGPSPATTGRTLDLLDRYGLRATFFVIGELADAHPDLVREMRDRGHAVGSHGHRHEHHLLRPPSWIRADTARSVAGLHDVLGETPRWYRPPYGQLTTLTILEARRHAMEVVLWTRWGKEFAEHAVQPVVDRLATGAMPGAILLLHDTDMSCPPGTAARTHATLGPLAELLAARELESVTLDELVPVPRSQIPAPEC